MKVLKFILYLAVALGAAFLFVSGIVIVIYSLKDGFGFLDIFYFNGAGGLFWLCWKIGNFALKKLADL